MVSVGTWSLFTSGLYGEMVYIAFLDRRNLLWCCKQVVFIQRLSLKQVRLM